MVSRIWQKKHISHRCQITEKQSLERNDRRKKETHRHIFDSEFFFLTTGSIITSTPSREMPYAERTSNICNWKCQFVLFKNVFTTLNKIRHNIFSTHKKICRGFFNVNVTEKAGSWQTLVATTEHTHTPPTHSHTFRKWEKRPYARMFINWIFVNIMGFTSYFTVIMSLMKPDLTSLSSRYYSFRARFVGSNL